MQSRDKLKEQEYFSYVKDWREKSVARYLDGMRQLKENGMNIPPKASFSLGREYTGLVYINFSKGEDLAIVKECTIKALDAICAGFSAHGEPDKAKIAVDIYENGLVLVALGKLLRVDEPLLLTYKKFWSDYNGKDALMEAMFDPSAAKGKLVFEKNYRVIANVFDLSEEERANEVKVYLTKWYASMKKASWYDGHKIAKTGGATNYTGYWCFEAAAVTALLNIDDTSFRDMDYYPKDLVDFYRNN